MHEHSLISNLVKRIEELAKKENSDKVTGVDVIIGALANISADHFREHFEHETKNTVCDGAVLNIQRSDDIHDSHAQEILLKCIEVEDK